MKVTDKKQIKRNSFKLNPVAAAIVLAMAAQFPANVAQANGAFGTNTDISGNVINVPTYYANSPQGIQPAFDPVTHTYSTAGVTVDTGVPLRKFVDPLGGVYNGLENLPGMSDLQSGIPVAITEKWKNPLTGVQTNDDYYEIAIVDYTERLHTDLAKATRLRGYVQIETPAIAAGLKDITGVVGSEHIPGTYPDGTPIKDTAGNQVYFVHKPHYLGPVILAAKGTAARFKFTNYLPYTDKNGNKVGAPNGDEAFIPVDESIAGGGPVTDATGKPMLDKNGNPIKFSQNRVAIHWHGGDSPWISDGTPHQWFTPAGDISNFVTDATHPNGMGKGDSAVNVPDMPDPGPGSYTLYFPNNLSGRLMMYHDHVSGLTKVNVYEGEAAGYVVYDPTELTMVANALGTSLGATAGGLPTGLLDAVGIPLVIQDKTFVPKNIGPNAVASDGVTPASQDAKWDLNHWGQPGDFWFPHVYETNQDPNSADGTNPVGRWDWGPWFWPVFPAQYSLPTGAYGDATATPEAFMDTPIVNGQAYPTLTVDPKTYRFRILSVANDRTQNLGLYQAVDAAGKVCDASNTAPAMAPAVPGGLAPVACTEVRMVPAVPTAGFPATWPTDGRAGGVPDPATAGPDIVQIGSEGGLLPAPAVWHSQPVSYEQNVRSITVFNILNHDLLLGGGERADVLIDFSKYAGQTLIMYNDAPAPMPGFDPRIDYYTGDGDQTGAGGAYNTAPGYGPNTRTVMQIKVNATNTSGVGGPLNVSALATALPTAYAATQPAPIIPEAVYNAPFSTASVNNYASIGTGSLLTNGLFTYVDNGVTKTLPVINKAIQELFDPVYGRMNATLGAELPFSSATVATTIPLAYIDAPIERLDAIKDGETQIWKITHNGVDSHPVHFHMVNVQVINRVGWDGTVKPPEANEVGWKETLRMNPLEDVYVAVKAARPVTPFGVPKSVRVLDPSQAVGSQLGFTQIDPTTGQAPTYQTYMVNGVMTNVPTTVYKNEPTSFDNEYVWHCHILGHEEQDFMRPFVFHPNVVVPDAPAAVTVSGSTVSWTDTTPVGGQDAQGIPTAGTNAAYPMPTNSPKNEIGYRVMHNKTVLGTVPANVTSWTDPTGPHQPSYYQVVAYNAAGNSAPGNATTTTTATTTMAAAGPAPAPGTFTLTGASIDSTGLIVTVTSTTGLLAGASVSGGGFPAGTSLATVTSATTFTTSLPSTTPSVTGQTLTVVNPAVAAPTLSAAPAAPGGLTQTLNADGSVTLAWTAVQGATAYIVTVNGVAYTITAPATSYVVPAANLIAGGNNTFTVAAQTLSGTTAVASTTVFTGAAVAPVVFNASLGATGTVTVNWANSPTNVNNLTGYTLSWIQCDATGVPLAGVAPVTEALAPNATGATVVNLTSGQYYSFQVVANSSLGNSASVLTTPVATQAP